MDIDVIEGKFATKYSPMWIGSFLPCNLGLVSLEGAPSKVAGNFNCSDNSLLSLNGGPKDVAGAFDCRNNKLLSLKDAPDYVGTNFICSSNNLITLEGAPKVIGCGFNCSYNKLMSLEGAPTIIERSFYCGNNRTLVSIQNINHHVKKIGEYFVTDDNLSGLISLLLIDEPPRGVDIGPLSDIFNDAIKKIHSGQDRMEVVMDVIINCPDEYAWQLGELE